MFIAVYEMKAKPGMEQQFRESWAAVTDAIMEHRGGLGSRLHETDTSGLFVAYAQWPSREAWQDRSGWDSFRSEQSRQVELMRQSLEYSKTVYELQVADDRLVQSV